MTTFLLIIIILLEAMGLNHAEENTEKLAQMIGLQNPLLKIEQPAPKIAGIKNENEFDLKTIPAFPEKIEQKDFKLSAGEALVVDLDSNKILYEKNAHESRPIASVTKMMTSIIVLEKNELDKIAPITAKSAYIMGSKMHLRPGDHIRIGDLVRGMLIASGNDAAAAISEFYGKEYLVDLMNKKASWLGMKETHFVDATGLDVGNLSSVYDLAILSRYAMKNDFFAKSVATKEYTIISANGLNQYPIHTTNRLLKNFPDIFGIKTGYTEEAGNCLVAGAKNQKVRVVSVVLNVADENVRFNESRDLIDWSFAGYKW